MRSPPSSPALPVVRPVEVVTANASPQSFARAANIKSGATRARHGVEAAPTTGETEAGAAAARYHHLCKRLYALPDPTYTAALNGEIICCRGQQSCQLRSSIFAISSLLLTIFVISCVLLIFFVVS